MDKLRPRCPENRESVHDESEAFLAAKPSLALLTTQTSVY
jgi:hypothetical protein